VTIRLQDTLSGETRPLVPLTPDHVGVYSCGPTVYGPAHIGNFRSFLFADLLVRHLRWRGLGVTWVMNITDVDDKIIRGSAASGETIETLAERYLAAFLDDAAALRMTTPDVMPRATRYIEQMATLIKTLLDGDHAYKTEDGSIFFRISSWPAYGRLARLDPDGLRVGERVEADEYGKDDVRDFALWKGPKPGEPVWETAIGPGRPGWHIECSAMSMAHLGPSFDIHTGGIDLIETLLERGHAYRTDDGSIFYRIASWPAYGRLARLDPEGLRVGERVEADEYGKDDVRDFALWKGPKPGEPVWQTAIGPGRPGWHIECSAMGMAHLGPSFDLHTGGVDLIFPHHEDEIAQSEAATGQTFVGTWLHCAHLQASGTKMAKSTGNIARVGEVLATGVSARALRLALISVHYRAGLNHSTDSLAAAAAALDRLDAAVAALGGYVEDGPDDPGIPDRLAAARTAFGEALDDDLNVSAGLAVVFDLVRDLNRRIERRSMSTADAGRAVETLRDIDQVLGILPDPEPVDGLDPTISALLEARVEARASRDFAASDRLRDELAALGVTVEDTRDGQRWRRTVDVGHG